MVAENRKPVLGWIMIILAIMVTTVAILGPFGFGAIRYRTSETTLNQIIGGDAAALLVVAPVCFLIGVLALRRHRAAPILALAPAIFAVYTYAQLIIGQEYLRLPGNNERYFPLLYSGFVIGGAAAVVAWRQIEPADIRPLSMRLARVAAAVMFCVGLFLIIQHLPTLVDAFRVSPTRTEYVSSPSAFWIVKLMDLGIIVPVTIACGIGLLRGAAWARVSAQAVTGGFTLLGASVTGMAITMYLHGDPDASVVTACAFATFTLAFAALAFVFYRR